MSHLVGLAKGGFTLALGVVLTLLVTDYVHTLGDLHRSNENLKAALTRVAQCENH